MKTLVIQYNSALCAKVLAVCESEEMAHTIAETISYRKNGSAIYGLFQIRLHRTCDGLPTGSLEEQAYTEFRNRS